jgi:hypothetical protein
MLKKNIIISLLIIYSINANGQLGELIGGVKDAVDNVKKSINNKKFTNLHQIKLDSFVSNKLTVLFLYRNFGEPDVDTTIQYEDKSYRIIRYQKYKSFKVRPFCESKSNQNINPCSFEYYFVIDDTVRYLGDEIYNFLPAEYFLESDKEKQNLIKKNKNLSLKRRLKYDYKDCKYELSFWDELILYNGIPRLKSKVYLKNIGTKRCEEWVRAVFKYSEIVNNEKLQKTSFFRFVLKDIEPEISIEITPNQGVSNFYEFLRFEKW